jgi:CheY-like chemotaxis protein
MIKVLGFDPERRFPQNIKETPGSYLNEVTFYSVPEREALSECLMKEAPAIILTACTFPSGEKSCLDFLATARNAAPATLLIIFFEGDAPKDRFIIACLKAGAFDLVSLNDSPQLRQTLHEAVTAEKRPQTNRVLRERRQAERSPDHAAEKSGTP